MALKQAAGQEAGSPIAKDQDEVDEILSTYTLQGDTDFFMKERELKLKAKAAKNLSKSLLSIQLKIAENNEWLDSVCKTLEPLSTRTTCMEKRQAVKVASGWDFRRMVPVEVETYGKMLAVGNLKAFVIFRALQIKNELALGTSWKTFLKKLWYKLLGRSLAWELACKEVLEALQHPKNGVTFLKSEEGWASDFDKNMSEVLKQPY